MSDVLKKLDEARIFSFSPEPGGLDLREECDGYFHLSLTLAEVRELAALMVAAAEQMPSTEETPIDLPLRQDPEQLARVWGASCVLRVEPGNGAAVLVCPQAR